MIREIFEAHHFPYGPAYEGLSVKETLGVLYVSAIRLVAAAKVSYETGVSLKTAFHTYGFDWPKGFDSLNQREQMAVIDAMLQDMAKLAKALELSVERRKESLN